MKLRSWENGTIPLFSTPYGQLQQLAETLDRAGAQVGKELGDLLLASRCDLLLTSMLNGFEDHAEVPPMDENGAEPENPATCSDGRWSGRSLTGIASTRHRSDCSTRNT